MIQPRNDTSTEAPATTLTSQTTEKVVMTTEVTTTVPKTTATIITDAPTSKPPTSPPKTPVRGPQVPMMQDQQDHQHPYPAESENVITPLIKSVEVPQDDHSECVLRSSDASANKLSQDLKSASVLDLLRILSNLRTPTYDNLNHITNQPTLSQDLKSASVLDLLRILSNLRTSTSENENNIQKQPAFSAQPFPYFRHNPYFYQPSPFVPNFYNPQYGNFNNMPGTMMPFNRMFMVPM